MGLRCSLEEGSLGWMQGQVWNLGILGGRWWLRLHFLCPEEARPGALVTWAMGLGAGISYETTSAVWACALACRALSRTGDGFSLFNFNFSLCGILELFEIDHPLIG